MRVIETVLPQPNHRIQFLKHRDLTFQLVYKTSCEGDSAPYFLRSEDLNAFLLTTNGWVKVADEVVLSAPRFVAKEYIGKTFHEIAEARADLLFDAAKDHLTMLYTTESHFAD